MAGQDRIVTTVLLVDNLVFLLVVELVHHDLRTLIGQRAGPGGQVPGVSLPHVLGEYLCSQLRFGAAGAVKVDRCIAPRQPAADVESHEVADVVDVQVTGKDLVELREVRPQGEQVSHRTHSHIEQELPSIAQFNEI